MTVLARVTVPPPLVVVLPPPSPFSPLYVTDARSIQRRTRMDREEDGRPRRPLHLFFLLPSLLDTEINVFGTWSLAASLFSSRIGKCSSEVGSTPSLSSFPPSLSPPLHPFVKAALKISM